MKTRNYAESYSEAHYQSIKFYILFIIHHTALHGRISCATRLRTRRRRRSHNGGSGSLRLRGSRLRGSLILGRLLFLRGSCIGLSYWQAIFGPQTEVQSFETVRGGPVAFRFFCGEPPACVRR